MVARTWAFIDFLKGIIEDEENKNNSR